MTRFIKRPSKHHILLSETGVWNIACIPLSEKHHKLLNRNRLSVVNRYAETKYHKVLSIQYLDVIHHLFEKAIQLVTALFQGL